jgi:hypothetical protein
MDYSDDATITIKQRRDESGQHWDLQEDISGTDSQIDLSESADVLQNLTHEYAPQSQNIL